MQNQPHHPTKLLSRLSIVALLGSLLASAPAWAQGSTIIRTSSFEYDASGLLIKEIIEPDSPNDCLQTTHSYDAYGNKTGTSTSTCAGASGYAVSSATTPRTASSSYGADGRFALSTTNVLGQSETRTYDERFGTVASLTGPNGLSTSWLYDGFGRKVRENRADGTYTTWAYLLCTDVGANCPGPIGGATVHWVVVEQSRAANGSASAPEKRQYHDSLNRVVRVQTQGFDGSGASPTLVQDTEYNALGQTARQSKLYALNGGTAYWSSYTYDALGRVIREEHPDPEAPGGVAVTTQSYNGLTITTTNSKNQTRTVTKDANGQTALVTDALGNTISYTYDALGQLLSTNAAGSVTTLSYNQRGQKTAMNDPAMGAWEYRYNVYGELVWQRDSLNQATTLAYDALGRLIQRSEPDLVSQWSYDKKFDGTACGKGVGKLCEAVADNGYRRVHHYDTLGRPSSTATVLDNPSSPATVSVSYDANTGRVASKTWPTGYQASYTYSALGYLSSVTGGGTNGFSQTVSYQVMAMDEQGHITQYRYGNQVTTVNSYNAANGRLGAQVATRDGQGNGNVLNRSYQHDALGNLTVRNDNSPGVGTQESFSYDALNRLTLATILGGAVSPPQVTEVLYDARGNITYKSDVGRYWYDAARPNRMTNVTLETAPGATIALTGSRALSYVFDDHLSGAQVANGVTVGNGNLMYTVSQDTVNGVHTLRSESYTSFNMPREIVFGNFITSTTSSADRTLSFVYGPEHQRIKQTVALSGNGTSIYSAGSTWYLNGDDGMGLSYEKEVKDNGTIEDKHYVSAGGVVFTMFVSRSGNLNGKPATTTNYFHHDHLGSLVAITDETGAVTERLAYDPWGKRRYVNGNHDVLDSIVGYHTDRGYTMHEHLEELGIIHMNGRVYDPLIGRFMSADPILQSPTNLQSFNRYAYVMNNPLLHIDPTGYSWVKIRSVVVRVVAAVADYYGCSGYCSGAVGAYEGAKNGGGWQGAVVGFAAGYYGYQYGGGYSVTGLAVSAAAGCATAYVAGGNCGQGAFNGAVSYYAGQQYGLSGQMAAGCINARVSGGSCGAGARDAATSAAVTYVVQGVIRAGVEIYRDAELQDQDQRMRATLAYACGPACILPAIPPAVSFGTLLWRSTVLYFSAMTLTENLGKLQNALSVDEVNGANSPEVSPSDVAGRSPAEIDQLAKEKGLKPKGPDPKNGKGAYIDPATGEQRILIHGDHAHVNDAAGNRLDVNGNRVPSNSPEAHLPIKP